MPRTLGMTIMICLSRYFLFVASVFLAVTTFEGTVSAAPSDKPEKTSEARQQPGKAKATSNKSKGGYFIEFRSRYALSYGHSFVIFGRVSPSGKMINPEVAGLHPSSDSVIPYMLGHIIPVPAETGWSDGDLEDQYKSANWRIMVSEPEYKKVVAYIRKKQGSSPVWHAAVYNCNAFAADIARYMGYKTPNIWLRPQEFMTKLREWNGGPNAIGSTGVPG